VRHPADSPSAPPPVLEVRGLSVTFRTRAGPVPAVRDVDLTIAPGELVALLGESGSGKSVTARAVMGLCPPNATVTADRLRLGDTDLLSTTDGELRRIRGSRMSLVFQDALSALNPVLSIGDQIGELFREHRGESRRAARAHAVQLLGQVGIPDPARRVGDYPHQFSGGMRQRILIAMAIALRPELVIADEPTTALDVTVQAQILELLDRLRREAASAEAGGQDGPGMGVLLITHDLGVVSEVADRVAVMYAGRIVESGDADEVLGRPGHPYTEALLRSVPRADLRGRDLAVIPGTPPSPSRLPDGCPFHPRCGWAVDTCRTVRPEPATLAGGRVTACHRAAEVLDAVPL